MILYRIVRSIYTSKLEASGRPARWNSKDVFMLYFSQNRALACLENMVHISSVDIHSDIFKVIVVSVPDSVTLLDISTLPKGWDSLSFEAYNICRSIGDKWIANNSSLLLKVPSVIIPDEFNFLMNPKHQDFSKVKIVKIEPFSFDGRIKK